MPLRKKKDSTPVNRVVLKNYSKVILFYPLLIYSIIAVIIQAFDDKFARPERPSLAILWIFIFLMNMIVIGFDFPTVKFFILFLVLILIILALVLLDVNGVIDLLSFWTFLKTMFDFTLDTKFYGWATFVLAFTLLGAFLQAQLHFVKIENNEVYVKGLAAGKSERFPTIQLQINTEITDVFELMALGAGKVTMKIGDAKIVSMEMVPMVRKKKKIIDRMLSSTKVEGK